MNYKSQLKGWAVDRAIEHQKSCAAYGKTTEDLLAIADKLLAYAYIPREDLESTAKDLFELVRNAESGQASIDALVGTLEHIKNDRISQGIDKFDLATPPLQETV